MNSTRNLRLSFTTLAILCSAGAAPAALADMVQVDPFPTVTEARVYFVDGDDHGAQSPEFPATVSFGNPDDQQDARRAASRAHSARHCSEAP